MATLTSIAAIGKNYELGRNNQLIWRFKDDMKFFRANTIGKTIVMGRKTFESLPGLLSGRKHIVLTHQDISIPDVCVLHHLDEALAMFSNMQGEVMIIGGASVYLMMMPYVDKMLLTEIDDTCDEADAFFPKFSSLDWDREVVGDGYENNTYFRHVKYCRKLVKEVK